MNYHWCYSHFKRHGHLLVLALIFDVFPPAFEGLGFCALAFLFDGQKALM